MSDFISRALLPWEYGMDPPWFVPPPTAYLFSSYTTDDFLSYNGQPDIGVFKMSFYLPKSFLGYDIEGWFEQNIPGLTLDALGKLPGEPGTAMRVLIMEVDNPEDSSQFALEWVVLAHGSPQLQLAVLIVILAPLLMIVLGALFSSQPWGQNLLNMGDTIFKDVTSTVKGATPGGALQSYAWVVGLIGFASIGTAMLVSKLTEGVPVNNTAWQQGQALTAPLAPPPVTVTASAPLGAGGVTVGVGSRPRPRRRGR